MLHQGRLQVSDKTPPFWDEFFGEKTNSPGNAEKHALHLVERQ